MADARASDQTEAPAPVGRPRLAPSQRSGMSAREEILDAAAQLFNEQGYAATSTRAIALAVGIKQASLYYHFSTKEQILSELLVTTIAQSLDAATALRDRTDPPEAKLWALASYDVHLLGTSRWNVGALYLLPELRSPRFTSFHARRARLREHYGSIIAEGIDRGSFTTDDPVVATDLVFRLVESAALVRQDHEDVSPDVLAPTIADSCLRLLACPTRKLTAAGRRGARMLDRIRPEAA